MTEEKLIRGIGRWDLTAIVINCIIGAGIFGLPSKVYGLIGSYSIVAFIACAIVIAMIVLCYAEVASRYASTGGPYLYARDAFGPAVAFEVGWLYWLARIATFAANCNLLIVYLGFFWPSVTSGATRIVMIAAAVLVLTGVNVLGIRQSTLFTNFFTVGKLVPLILFAVIGLAFVDPSNFNFDAAPQYGSVSTAVITLLYAFVGFEVAVIPAGEVSDPQKAFPFALLIGLGVVAVIYILVQIVCIGTLPELAASERPLADAAAHFIGPLGAVLIVAGASISIFGNLNVGLLGASRLVYAMGDRRDLPSLVAITHDTLKTPYISLLINAVVILFLTIQSSFVSALTMATITRLLVYASTCVALPVFRKRDVGENHAFRIPFGMVIPVVSLLLIAWLLTAVDYTKEGFPVIVATLVGFGLLLITRLTTRSKAS